MHINLILIPLIIVLGVALGAKDSKANRRLYIFICTAVLAFVASMRSPEWFTYTYSIDTLNYKDMFEKSTDLNWNEFWASVYLRYFGNGNDESDVGFLGLNRLIGLFTNDFAIFSLIADMIFFIPFAVILYRYCTNMRQIIFAFVFYVSMIQVFLLGGARQIFSIGFDMMALLAVLDGKKLRAAFAILLAVSIHFSSLIFLIPLVMIWLNLRPRTLKLAHLLSLFVLPIVLAFPNQFIVFMGEAVGIDKYAAYGERGIAGGAMTFVVLIAFLSIYCMVAIKKNNLQASKTLRDFYVMLTPMSIFAPLIRSNGSMIRISLYFHLFLAILVPFALDCMFNKRDQTFAYVIVIAALSFLSISGGGMEYYFFWER